MTLDLSCRNHDRLTVESLSQELETFVLDLSNRKPYIHQHHPESESGPANLIDECSDKGTQMPNMFTPVVWSCHDWKGWVFMALHCLQKVEFSTVNHVSHLIGTQEQGWPELTDSQFSSNRWSLTGPDKLVVSSFMGTNRFGQWNLVSLFIVVYQDYSVDYRMKNP